MESTNEEIFLGIFHLLFQQGIDHAFIGKQAGRLKCTDSLFPLRFPVHPNR